MAPGLTRWAGQPRIESARSPFHVAPTSASQPSASARAGAAFSRARISRAAESGGRASSGLPSPRRQRPCPRSACASSYGTPRSRQPIAASAKCAPACRVLTPSFRKQPMHAHHRVRLEGQSPRGQAGLELRRQLSGERLVFAGQSGPHHLWSVLHRGNTTRARARIRRAGFGSPPRRPVGDGRPTSPRSVRHALRGLTLKASVFQPRHEGHDFSDIAPAGEEEGLQRAQRHQVPRILCLFQHGRESSSFEQGSLPFSRMAEVLDEPHAEVDEEYVESVTAGELDASARRTESRVRSLHVHEEIDVVDVDSRSLGSQSLRPCSRRRSPRRRRGRRGLQGRDAPHRASTSPRLVQATQARSQISIARVAASTTCLAPAP